MSLQIAVATEDLAGPLRNALDRAARLKVDGVRLNSRSELDIARASDSELRQMLHYARERQLQIAGLLCPVRHALYEEQYLEPRLEVLRQTMAAARKLQTKDVIVRCGSIPSEQTSSTKEPTTADSFETLFGVSSAPAEKSPQAQFTLLCELLNDLTRYGNHVGCVLNLILTDYNAPGLQQLLAEVKNGPCRIVFDPATAVMNQADPEDVFRTLYDHIGYLRARDAGTNLDGGGLEVAVGDGNVDWLQLLPTITEAEFPGWVCVERTGGDSRAADVAKGLQTIRQFVPQAEN